VTSDQSHQLHDAIDILTNAIQSAYASMDDIASFWMRDTADVDPQFAPEQWELGDDGEIVPKA